jgi:hypothetical protein
MQMMLTASLGDTVAEDLDRVLSLSVDVRFG